MKVEKEIGNGPDYVYVYYGDNDKKLALLEKRDRWECKIGFSSVNPIDRISDQGIQTCLAREPIIGLLIRTTNGYYTESLLHKSLYQYKVKTNTNVCGDEWFFTNPEEIENIFLHNISPKTLPLKHYCEYDITPLTPLGDTLNLHRKKINLTQVKLTEMVGVSRDTISRFFSGDTATSIGTVIKILEALELDITIKSKLPSKELKIHTSNRKAR